LEYSARLVWSDEFDGPKLNTSNWDEREDGIVNNGELQMYRRKNGNAYVEDGHLRIAAKCESYMGQEYTSSKLHSRVMFHTGHRVEARLRVSTGMGTWPAFWLMGSGTSWPRVGEIDIFEYTGCKQDRAMGNLHTESRHGENCIRAYTQHGTDVQTWHRYRVDWVKIGMTFYIDDEVVVGILFANCAMAQACFAGRMWMQYVNRS